MVDGPPIQRENLARQLTAETAENTTAAAQTKPFKCRTLACSKDRFPVLSEGSRDGERYDKNMVRNTV